MKFTKMNGLGNDYIFVYTETERVNDPHKAARILSDRHKGVGGDGLVLIGKTDSADFSMKIFNADGSEGEMCGNALRCVGKYVFEKGLTDKTELSIGTLSGIKKLKLAIEERNVVSVSANIGKVSLGHKHNGDFVRRIEACGKIYQCYCVSVGNPHCVVFVGQYNENTMKVGKSLSENIGYFPERTNVEFVLMSSDRDALTMRVYERGSGETMACGTGAAAAFYASNRLRLVDDSVTVKLNGGNLRCELSSTGELIQTGTADFNFEGETNLI